MPHNETRGAPLATVAPRGVDSLPALDGRNPTHPTLDPQRLALVFVLRRVRVSRRVAAVVAELANIGGAR